MSLKALAQLPVTQPKLLYWLQTTVLLGGSIALFLEAIPLSLVCKAIFLLLLLSCVRLWILSSRNSLLKKEMTQKVDTIKSSAGARLRSAAEDLRSLMKQPSVFTQQLEQVVRRLESSDTEAHQ